MPWQVSEQDGKFCVVKKSDGKVVKCHNTRKEANSHIAALYVNEPSATKKGVGYGMLKSLIEERVEELKACGANKPGGGGFAAGNTCARGGGGGGPQYQLDLSGVRRRIAKQEQDGITVLHGPASGKHDKYIATDGKKESRADTPQNAVNKLKRQSR